MPGCAEGGLAAERRMRNVKRGRDSSDSSETCIWLERGLHLAHTLCHEGPGQLPGDYVSRLCRPSDAATAVAWKRHQGHPV
jgi:hypothetical protein